MRAFFVDQDSQPLCWSSGLTIFANLARLRFSDHHSKWGDHANLTKGRCKNRVLFLWFFCKKMRNFYILIFFIIPVARHGSGWHVATTTIESSYRAFSTEKIIARVGTYIGLDHVNVTLIGNTKLNQIRTLMY